jgi:signal transduction histidine kinase
MFEISINDPGQAEKSALAICKNTDRMDKDMVKITESPTILKGMSHEMRTHMNAIVAFSFLMKDTGCSANDREEFSKQILSSCDQLLGLFDTFFDSAIIESVKSDIDNKSCKLDSILDELLPEFRETLRKEAPEGLELITETQFNNSTDILIDKNRIFRVIRCLFSNSVRNTNSGYIKIGYSVKDELITFYILDSGQGYFKCKEFLQSEDLNISLTKYNDTHSAINITLAKKLINLLGGTIWIDSNGLNGSGIYFSVPVKTGNSSEASINKYISNMIAI